VGKDVSVDRDRTSIFVLPALQVANASENRHGVSARNCRSNFATQQRTKDKARLMQFIEDLTHLLHPLASDPGIGRITARKIYHAGDGTIVPQ
jgi:hypothetical protein